MGAILIPVVIVVILIAVLATGVKRWAAQGRAESADLASPGTPTLDYRVPAEQDPTAVLTALSQEGFHTTTDPVDTRVLHVDCPAGPDRDRAHVRAVIATVGATGIESAAPYEPDVVRFRDET